MDINALRRSIAARDTCSILETIDIHTGVRTVLRGFDHVIEAPNWTHDGEYPIYNSQARIYRCALATGGIQVIDTGFAIDCNNDHVLSLDNAQLGVSHFTFEDALSLNYASSRSMAENPRLLRNYWMARARSM